MNWGPKVPCISTSYVILCHVQDLFVYKAGEVNNEYIEIYWELRESVDTHEPRSYSTALFRFPTSLVNEVVVLWEKQDSVWNVGERTCEWEYTAK